MDSDCARLVTLRPYRPFLPLFLSLAGWALLQLWLYLVGGNLRAHLTAACFGLVLAAWSALRFPIGGDKLAEQAAQTPGESGRASGALLLLVLGSAFALLAVKGSVILLGMLAVAANFIPWDRLTPHWRHPLQPCAIAGAGFGAAFVAGYDSSDVMLLPVAAWACWLGSLLGLILRAERRRRAERAAGLAPGPISTAAGNK